MVNHRVSSILVLLLLFIATSPLSVFATTGSDSVYVEAKVRSKANNIISFSEWRKFATRTVDQLLENNSSKKILLNKYGSDKSKQYVSTGFFRTEKINGKWWTIDPDGYAGLHIAVNSINQGKSDRNLSKFKSVYGDEKRWMSQTADLITEHGFNGTGSWSETDLIIAQNKTATKPLAYTVMLNLMSEYGNKRGGTYQEAGHKGYPNNTIFVFDPGFEAFCDKAASKLVKYKDDKNLFGYFTDNELPFSLKNLEDYLSLSNKNDAGYLAAKKWIDEKGIHPEQITEKNKAEFLGFVADKYFSIVSKSIRKYDPNHMIIGSRFYSGEKNVPDFMRSAGKYLDAISINYYGVWSPSQKSMENWEKWSERPFIITEYYVKAEDSGLTNQSGAGWIVRTQQERGLFYQNFCIGLLESKSCIGWHWFKYQDNDPTYTKADPSNNDANKGIVDNEYKSYQPLLDQMKKLNTNRFRIIEYFIKMSNESVK